ncbi:MAG: DNA methyltransferase [Candidatus Aenigmatarchaeota archaeon]|nr:site-specific DNA-methyltransferase [Candidatus Aenigmarchaeota archaeon]
MGKVYYYFKLFNSIKDPTETVFAELELQGLLGKVTQIKNFTDILLERPLSLFTKEGIRIQDIITYELPYGEVQGFSFVSDKIQDISHLVSRLAYTREIYIIIETDNPEKTLKQIFPNAVLDKNAQYFKVDKFTLFRFITHQYFLEKSQYISKLSRNEKEVDKNVETLFAYPFKQIYRIPAPVTTAVGKRLEDYFTTREEPSLYLNHYMHPYKGKFHPKMVRALLNYICPQSKAVVLDNFAGSGTLLVEASYLGLDSFGVEINPLSVLMSNVKCNSVKIPIEKLKKEIDRYIKMVENEINAFSSGKSKSFFFRSNLNYDEIRKESKQLQKELANPTVAYNGEVFKKSEFLVQKIIIARELLKKIEDKDIREFLLLSLSGAISDIARRVRNEFEKVLADRINDLYLRLYLFHRLNEVLKINLGEAYTYCDDTRDMTKIIESNRIDGIVNSPPYSTALDYIKNDYPQLILLRLVNSMEELERNMMGNPRVNYDKRELLKMIKDEEKDPLKLSTLAKKYVDILMSNGRQSAGLRVYKFFIDMLFTLKEMYRVMKKGAKAVIIIGNNHFLVSNRYIEIPNDEIILEIGKKIGFNEDNAIRRELQKSSVGNIRQEMVIIFEK